MPKIAIVGAGGWVLPLRLIRDIVSYSALQGTEFALHDIEVARAERTLAGAQKQG